MSIIFSLCYFLWFIFISRNRKFCHRNSILQGNMAKVLQTHSSKLLVETQLKGDDSERADQFLNKERQAFIDLWDELSLIIFVGHVHGSKRCFLSYARHMSTTLVTRLTNCCPTFAAGDIILYKHTGLMLHSGPL